MEVARAGVDGDALEGELSILGFGLSTVDGEFAGVLAEVVGVPVGVTDELPGELTAWGAAKTLAARLTHSRATSHAQLGPNNMFLPSFLCSVWSVIQPQ